jgi:hypothetical protein
MNELSALKDADSLALDPHKWMYVPVKAGLSLVRDGIAEGWVLGDVHGLVRQSTN